MFLHEIMGRELHEINSVPSSSSTKVTLIYKVASSIGNDTYIGLSKKPSKKRCCVNGCYSTYEDVPKPSFYRFPQLNIEQRKLWIKVRIMSIRQGIE